MKVYQQFNKSLVTTAISAVLGTSIALPSIAQEMNDDDNMEVIEVQGLRSSLQEAAAIKRSSAGVVDAISAEDIGKFPDTNLAESLQRITGVSISRTNGEGAEVTVRGFGGSNNMITLNGRMMPAARTYGGGSGGTNTMGGATRAFDFSNLASEGIKAVEVYKTGKADIATGGIGATINILTARPLDNPGFRSSVGVKAVHDTTNRVGDDITPEVSGIINWSDDDAKFGVSAAASIQKRDSGYIGATVNDWNIGTWGDPNDPNTIYDTENMDVFENVPEDGQLYARPNDLRYEFSDTSRTRTNAQLTLQYAPNDDLTATLDYFYAENHVEEKLGQIGNWMQNGSNITRVIFDDSAVATPIYVAEDYVGTVDEGYEQAYREQENTLNSLGLNIEWYAKDNLRLSFDAHNSKMESLPAGPSNNMPSGEIGVGIGSPTVASREWWFDPTLPTYHNVYDDSEKGNNNGVLDKADVGSSIMRFRYASQVTEIEEYKLNGSYLFDRGSVDFGVEGRWMDMTAQQTAGDNQTLGNWGIANPGEFPEGLLGRIDYAEEFDDYDIGQSQGLGFTGDAVALAREALELYPDTTFFGVSPVIANDDMVEEDTLAAYFQVHLEGELGGKTVNVLAGIRYESTDVTSTSLVTPPSYLIWENNNDFSVYTDPATETVPLAADASYDNLLPSLDFDIMLTDEVKARFSYGKTIARAPYGSLRNSPSGFGTSGSTLNGTKPGADMANPGLLPLESDNFDLSLEYYYNDTSYASAGFFEKRVSNFIGTGNQDMTFFGIRDQTVGPRAQAAAEALRDRGFAVDDTSLFAMMVLLEHPEAFPNGAADYTGSSDQLLRLGETQGWDLIPNEDDPEMVFRTSMPQNNKEAKLYGGEFAIQHFFGESGFGVQANYTIVRGDIGFDNEGSPEVSQFALVGLSDTANLVLIYEKDGLTGRLAYNWRDEYLNRINQGGSNNPGYIEAYAQIDMNVSYDVTDNLTVFFEGLNLTDEDPREHARNENQLWYMLDLGARYNLGARYTF